MIERRVDPVPTRGWTLRVPTPEDADALGAFHHASWRETYAELLPPSFWTEYTAKAALVQWRGLIGADMPDRRLVLAERDARVLGLVLAASADPRLTPAWPPVRSTQLYQLYVARSEHGTGLGQALLDGVLPAAEPAQLWVAEANPRAQAFYRRNGFTPDGARLVDPGRHAGLVEIRMIR